MLVSFANTLAVRIPRRKCVKQNNTKFSFHQISDTSWVSLQNRTSASTNCTGVFLQNKSPSLPHITHLLEKENLDMILTILILKEPPKSSFLWGHLNPVIVSFYPVFHPSQLCPLTRYPLLKSDTKPHSSDLWLTLIFPALHPFRFAAYSIN